MPVIVIFGHSHALAVKNALKHWNSSKVEFEIPVSGTKEFPGRLIYKHGKQKVRPSPIVTSIINRYSKQTYSEDTWLVSMAHGNYYNQFGMFAENRIFDFVFDELPQLGLEPGADYLPYNSVKAALENSMTPLKSYVPAMAKSYFGKRFIIVGPPPPVGDDELVAKRIQTGQENLRVTPKAVRLKLWYLQNKIAKSYCDNAGIHYFNGAVDGTFDKDGFLLDEQVKDCVHGNHIYGQKLLESLQNYVLNIKANK